MQRGEIITFGYGTFVAEPGGGITHLDDLMCDPNTFVVDIRLSPYASKDFPIWHGHSLKGRYGYNAQRKARYVHIEELGNLNYKKDDRHKGFMLQNKEDGISRLILALSFGWRLVLLCGCRDYAHCHRSLVVQLLMAELPGVKVTHVEEIERVEREPVVITAEQAALFDVAEPYVWRDI